MIHRIRIRTVFRSAALVAIVSAALQAAPARAETFDHFRQPVTLQFLTTRDRSLIKDWSEVGQMKILAYVTAFSLGANKHWKLLGREAESNVADTMRAIVLKSLAGGFNVNPQISAGVADGESFAAERDIDLPASRSVANALKDLLGK